MKFSALSTNLFDIMMQVTEWKYSFPVLRFDLQGVVCAHMPCFCRPMQPYFNCNFKPVCPQLHKMWPSFNICTLFYKLVTRLYKTKPNCTMEQRQVTLPWTSCTTRLFALSVFHDSGFEGHLLWVLWHTWIISLLSPKSLKSKLLCWFHFLS